MMIRVMEMRTMLLKTIKQADIKILDEAMGMFGMLKGTIAGKGNTRHGQ